MTSITFTMDTYEAVTILFTLDRYSRYIKDCLEDEQLNENRRACVEDFVRIHDETQAIYNRLNEALKPPVQRI